MKEQVINLLCPVGKCNQAAIRHAVKCGYGFVSHAVKCEFEFSTLLVIY